LAAKPVIDILVGISTWPAPPGVRQRLVGLGYEDLDEAGVSGRIYLRRRNGQAFNVALVLHLGSQWVANLALRGYLRATPEAASTYAEEGARCERKCDAARVFGSEGANRRRADPKESLGHPLMAASVGRAVTIE
jgi:GrpB-like predicted nucleotidyltransferase (UPF0157 family)